MKIKSYKETIIRDKIVSKVKPEEIKKTSKHWKAKIFLDGKWVAKVKIPNTHNRIMHHSKSQFIARALKLNPNDFNRLIDCPLRGPEYYRKLAKAVN